MRYPRTIKRLVSEDAIDCWNVSNWVGSGTAALSVSATKTRLSAIGPNLDIRPRLRNGSG